MNLIVAVNSDWGIGKDGTQTVVIPEDRKRFRQLTDGATVIVGRRTLLDFPDGKPLPGRKNIVLTRNKHLKIDGATVVTTVDELFGVLKQTDPDRVFVIGGESVFKMLVPYCRYAYVTKIKSAPQSDVFFPNLDALENWTLEDAGEWNSYNGVEYAFQRYINKSPQVYNEMSDADV
jgi:dihydrofolate reductase